MTSQHCKLMCSTIHGKEEEGTQKEHRGSNVRHLELEMSGYDLLKLAAPKSICMSLNKTGPC